MHPTRRHALRHWAGLLAARGLLSAQEPPPVDFVCPMDPDVHSATPGVCPRCRMKLVAGLPEPREYPIQLQTTPRLVRTGQPVSLRFRIRDPRTRQPVQRYEIVHEKLFHLFLVSEDLATFAHEHPELQPDGSFVLRTRLPQAGLYRVLADFYPAGGTPQMAMTTLHVIGPEPARVPLTPVPGPLQGANLSVAFRTEPAECLAGQKTLLFFTLSPADALEPYLGAWGHMLAASADGIDLMHLHPALADGGPQVQFNLIFPRPGLHKLWVQFQRAGVVNTVAFVLPVRAL